MWRAAFRTPFFLSPSFMPIAFKEWAVTVRALAEGEQLLTLRKGGIREPDKHFALEHDRFFLYPTFDHQRNDLVRESHQPELRRALEEGVWPDGEPPAQRADAGRRDPAAGPRAHPRLGRGAPATWTSPTAARSTRCRPFYVWTHGLRREAAGLEAPPPAARAAAAHLPHPAPGDGAGCARTTADAAPGWRSRATSPSRARPCSRTRSSSAPPRRSRRSPRTPCRSWLNSARTGAPHAGAWINRPTFQQVIEIKKRAPR